MSLLLIFPSLETQLVARDALCNDMMLLGPGVCWTKTKIQDSVGLLELT